MITLFLCVVIPLIYTFLGFIVCAVYSHFQEINFEKINDDLLILYILLWPIFIPINIILSITRKIIVGFTKKQQFINKYSKELWKIRNKSLEEIIKYYDDVYTYYLVYYEEAKKKDEGVNREIYQGEREISNKEFWFKEIIHIQDEIKTIEKYLVGPTPEEIEKQERRTLIKKMIEEVEQTKYACSNNKQGVKCPNRN